MRKTYSCLLILTLFISCTTDSTITDTASQPDSALLRSPGSNANPYDAAGQIHNELFFEYYNSGNLPTTVSGIAARVELLAMANSSFSAIKGSNYQSVSASKVQSLLDNPATCVADVIGASTLSARAKTSLTGFVNDFDDLYKIEDDYDTIAAMVIAYENTVAADSLLTANDKKIMLTTASIARNASWCSRRKPKKNTDPGWAMMVGNIIAATGGAEYGTAEAITMALVTGIAQN